MNTNKTTKPNIKKLIQDYFKKEKIMQLATSADGKPWICNVWAIADKDMNIYWFSSIKTRHSQELAKNPYVAAAFCLPQDPSDNSVRGIQLEGTAEMLTNQEDIDVAIGCCVGQIFSIKQVKQFLSNTYEPHRFYRIRPTMIILVDTVNNPTNPHQEYIPTKE